MNPSEDSVIEPEMLRLQVYIEGDFSFYSYTHTLRSVSDYHKQLEEEMGDLFQHKVYIKVFSIQDSKRSDINPRYLMGDVFQNNDFVFPIRSLLNITAVDIQPLVLKIPRSLTDDSHTPRDEIYDQAAPPKRQSLGSSGFVEKTPIQFETQPSTKHLSPTQFVPPEPKPVVLKTHSHSFPHAHTTPIISGGRCQPYCRPLAPFDVYDMKCEKCGEIKAFCPNSGSYCTSLCMAGKNRKIKSQGMDFCSICIGRYRQSKYESGMPHQCKKCKRPWLILNDDGHCRTCHTFLSGRSKRRKSGEQLVTDTPFRPRNRKK
ncbi:hypothetical protein ADUPG1_013031 [Aduncisulcus paluster]|uniref:Nucleolar protein Dnt1-like N-terminal domain-containing protein n=1 Tax=Aduncisulcus paluster TaxID=2918883 RepID=A0ABQ5K3J0_9EUKA|nr:hypothetical protein ADUPG1_013031 [Aduncisulcus paluster]